MNFWHPVRFVVRSSNRYFRTNNPMEGRTMGRTNLSKNGFSEALELMNIWVLNQSVSMEWWLSSSGSDVIESSQAVCIQVGYSGGESSFNCLSHYSSKRITQWTFFKPLQNWKKKSAVCYLLFLKPNFERPRVLVALRRSALNGNRHSPSLLRRWNTSVAIN